MIAPVKVKEILTHMDGERFDVVQKYETIDAMWGMEHRVLTDEDIKALKEGKYLYCSDGEYAQLISYKAEQDQKFGNWIPVVTEGLPEERKTVIASTDYGVYPEARYTKEYGWEWAYEAGADYWKELEGVTAWMPLPAIYEPQESEKSNGK